MSDRKIAISFLLSGAAIHDEQQDAEQREKKFDRQKVILVLPIQLRTRFSSSFYLKILGEWYVEASSKETRKRVALLFVGRKLLSLSMFLSRIIIIIIARVCVHVSVLRTSPVAKWRHSKMTYACYLGWYFGTWNAGASPETNSSPSGCRVKYVIRYRSR